MRVLVHPCTGLERFEAQRMSASCSDFPVHLDQRADSRLGIVLVRAIQHCKPARWWQVNFAYQRSDHELLGNVRLAQERIVLLGECDEPARGRQV